MQRPSGARASNEAQCRDRDKRDQTNQTDHLTVDKREVMEGTTCNESGFRHGGTRRTVGIVQVDWIRAFRPTDPLLTNSLQ